MLTCIDAVDDEAAEQGQHKYWVTFPDYGNSESVDLGDIELPAAAGAADGAANSSSRDRRSGSHDDDDRGRGGRGGGDEGRTAAAVETGEGAAAQETATATLEGETVETGASAVAAAGTGRAANDLRRRRIYCSACCKTRGTPLRQSAATTGSALLRTRARSV